MNLRSLPEQSAVLALKDLPDRPTRRGIPMGVPPTLWSE